jgi:hypothetical protein
VSEKYIHLMGAEEVSRAASNMQGAAETINRAAGRIDESLRNFIIQFEALVFRLETLKTPEK